MHANPHNVSMPELPEVTTYVAYFNRTSLRQKITRVECRDAKLIKNVSRAAFTKALTGHAFGKARRRGKFLIAPVTGSKQLLVIHFGMTGSLAYYPTGAAPDDAKRFGRVVFRFVGGHELAWLDQRKFGRVFLVTDLNDIDLLAHMGPEPLDLTERKFAALLAQHETVNVKAFLLDQEDIAGIGNNYSNEMLFRAGIDPHRRIADLSPRERRALYRAMERVLRDAVRLKPHEDFSEFPDSWLLAHKDDLRCPKDPHHRLKRATVAGRTAIYCPTHQH